MDSDDEYERRPRGREKFRRERSEYNDRSGRRDERSSRRDDWSDRRRPAWDSRRKDYRDFDRDRRDSGGRHHEISPPMKRVRRDWDNVGYQGEYAGYNPMANQWVSPMEIQQGVHQRPIDNAQHPVDTNSGPSMMTFKQFLNSMDDNIDDMEAVKKYQDYKVEFRKMQIADFFTTHKDEEWFRNKYHPDDSNTYQSKLKAAIRKRAAVFVNLLQSGWIERFSLTVDQGEDIIKLLDAAVIKFEGGSDLDLQVLNESAEKEVKNELNSKESLQPKSDRQNGNKEISQDKDAPPVSPSSVPLPETPAPPSASVKGTGIRVEPLGIKALQMSTPSPEQVKLREEAEKYHQQQLQQQQQQEQKQQQEQNQPNVQQELGQKRKRKRRHREPYYYDGNGESESESESDVESEPAPPGEESVPTDAQERAAEECLLPPGVDVEPISADEVIANQGGEPTQSVKVPGTEGNEESFTSELSEAGKGNSGTEAGNEQKATGDNNTKEEITSERRSNVQSETDQSLVAQPQEPNESESKQSEVESMEESEHKTEENKTDKNLVELEEKVDEPSAAGIEEKTPESEENKISDNVDAEVKSEPSKNAENDVKPEVLEETKTPRALHRTVSLFVRNVPPKISHNDIASVCSRFAGFMRVVLSDPAPERKFSRRGWITFKPDVTIKDICWSINNIKIKEIELNAVVNRELQRRVRTVSGAAVLKDIVKTDIDMATKLIQQLDEKFGLWKNLDEPVKKVDDELLKKAESTIEEKTDQGKKPEESSESVTPPKEETDLIEKKSELVAEETIPKTNPVLALLPTNLPNDIPVKKEETVTKTDDEEGQIPDEGQAQPSGQISAHPQPTVDESLVKLLDYLVLYLRIVHSLDYYSGAEYLYEDDMPNRCGIIHIRNSLPDKVNYEEVTEWHKNLHQKLEQHLQKKERLADEDANHLGKKDQDQEMEKFIQANTQELAKDKWLCPLSGKKFRGPEFVKKHIFNKHADKIEAVKTEVTFFNNFVYDPKRPSEPEVRSASQSMPGNQPFPAGVSPPVGLQGAMGWGRVGMMQPGGRGGFASSQVSPTFRTGPDHFSNRGQSYQTKPRRGSVRRDPRQIVQYKDLDAPGDDFEFF